MYAIYVKKYLYIHVFTIDVSIFVRKLKIVET